MLFGKSTQDGLTRRSAPRRGATATGFVTCSDPVHGPSVATDDCNNRGKRLSARLWLRSRRSGYPSDRISRMRRRSRRSVAAPNFTKEIGKGYHKRERSQTPDRGGLRNCASTIIRHGCYLGKPNQSGERMRHRDRQVCAPINNRRARPLVSPASAGVIRSAVDMGAETNHLPALIDYTPVADLGHRLKQFFKPGRVYMPDVAIEWPLTQQRDEARSVTRRNDRGRQALLSCNVEVFGWIEACILTM